MSARTALYVIVTSLHIWCVLSGCLSREQFLASLDRSKTLVFEAEIVQLTNHPISRTSLEAGQDAFVRVKKIIHQPPYSWQMSPGNLAHIRGLRPRVVDSYSCLPKLSVGQNYLWVTLSSIRGDKSREASLSFYPGGLFDVIADGDQKKYKDLQPDIPQQDAAFSPYAPSNYPGEKILPFQIELTSCDPGPCPTHLDPVCGTDGVLYQNPCFLQQRSCQQATSSEDHTLDSVQRRTLRIDRSKRCGVVYDNGKYNHAAVLCPSSNLCTYGATCLSNSSTAPAPAQNFLSSCDCRHIRCSGDRPSAVCASDGETYANECYLKKSMCVLQQAKRIRYYGTCASNPCLGHSCRWPGERCEVDESGQPKCVCPEHCPAVVIPVCGSDGMTYDSHCHLEQTACLKMRDIWVVYAGQCSEEPQCQNLGLYCQGYEICSRVQARQIHSEVRSGDIQGQPNDQSTIASCLCPVCPEKGLGEKVCGTDGRTYRSECHLRAHACHYQLYEVKVRSRGPCDACSNKQCKYYAICQRNMDGEPQCICPTDCPYTGARNTVCGTDGNTYENECHLKVRSCAEQRELFVASEGPCKTCPHGCPLGYQCRNGECVCREACPESNELEPEVCGTDGRLYRSECELKRQACVQGTSVEIDPSGVNCGREHAKADELQAAALPQADQNVVTTCTCNSIGALSEYCDPKDKCHCKAGAGGAKCDRCIAGYWGIQNGHQCIACSCHPYGSLGTSCDQVTGQCDCRPGILGRQCSICPEGQRLDKSGCISGNDFEELQIEPPPSPDSLLEDNDRPIENPLIKKLAGRLFSVQTTLLVRAPASLDQPVTVEVLLIPATKEGIILQYRAAPTEQEQLLVQNLQDHQFSLLLTGGHIECNYLDGRYPNRLLVVRSRELVRLNMQHHIRAGVTTNRPWLQVDSGMPTTIAEVGTRWVFDSDHGSLHLGGYGTVVVGRPVLSMAQSARGLSGALLTEGFKGCLLRLRIQTGQKQTQHEVDLISGDRTYLAWIGVDRLPSGVYEAPICTSVIKPTQQQQQDYAPIQSDARPTATVICENSMPCANGGFCIPVDRDQYECVCQPGWQGKHCEELVTVIPQFDGTSFVRLPGPNGKQAMQRKRLNLVLNVLITKSPGLILFIPPSGSDHTGPFIAVYVDGQNYLVVLCRVGASSGQATRHHSRIVQLRYRIALKLHTWHAITIDKLAKLMNVQIDGGEIQQIHILPNQFGRMPRKLRNQLSNFDLSKSPIYLGGYPFDEDPVDFMDIHNGLTGAIQKVIINGAEAVLSGSPSAATTTSLRPLTSRTEHWQNVSQWQGPPCGPAYSPCRRDRPESVCRPQGDTAVCACSTPLQMLKILSKQAENNVDKAEQLACEQRRKEIEFEERNLKSQSQNRLETNDMQYDEFSVKRKRPTFSKTYQPDETSVGKCGQLPIRFNGNTTLRFANLIKSTIDYNLRLEIQTASQHGILIFMLDIPTEPHISRGSRAMAVASQREVTVVALRNGRIEFSIHAVSIDRSWTVNDLRQLNGRTVATLLQLKSDILVNDGQCHRVHAVRSYQKATLLIDNIMTPGEFISHSPSSSSDNLIFLGGAPISIAGFPWEYHQNVTACLADMYVNEQKVNMLRSSSGYPTAPAEVCG